jgi:hypothetical protein
LFRVFFFAFLFLFSSSACSEVNFTAVKNKDPIPTPEIEVSPLEINFGEVGSAANELRTITVTNLSTVALHVTDVQLSAQHSFTMFVEDTEFVLEENEIREIEVAFSPEDEVDFSGYVTIFSDDSDEAEVVVNLWGALAAPELVISPDAHDFGALDIPCKDSVEITLTNIGLEPLEIYSLDFQSSDGQMTLHDMNAWPLTLPAMGETTVDVRIEAFMPGNTYGTIVVDSNDPRGLVEANQVGKPGYIDSVTEQFAVPDPVLDVFTGPLKSIETFTAPSRVSESYILPDNPPVDIVFAVDQSCSMDSVNIPLGNAFSSFITEINNVTNDWRIGVATNDNGCFNNGVIDAGTANYSSVFQAAVASGGCSAGSPTCDTEALFRITNEALSRTTAGSCNQNFLRNGAFLHIIMVSDEEEQSNVGWSSWLNQYVNYVSSASLLKVSTIADIYTQCGDGTGADGYVEMAGFTGGEVLNVCTSDWSNKTQDLALATVAGINEVQLTGIASEPTIEVYVDGVQWTTDWHYDSSTQSVVFDVAMDGGEDVEVVYIPQAWLVDYLLTDIPVTGTISVYVDGAKWSSNWQYDSAKNGIAFSVSLPDAATVEVQYLSSSAVVEFPLSAVPLVSTMEVRVDGYAWPTNWQYDASANSVRFDVLLPEGALIEIEYMDTSASAVFPLSQSPDPASLRVYVDGIEWVQDWHFAAATQSVVFDVDLDPGSIIDVTYGVFGTCP